MCTLVHDQFFKAKSFVALAVWKKGIMQLPKKREIKESDHHSAKREKKAKLLNSVVTKQ